MPTSIPTLTGKKFGVFLPFSAYICCKSSSIREAFSVNFTPLGVRVQPCSELMTSCRPNSASRLPMYLFRVSTEAPMASAALRLLRHSPRVESINRLSMFCRSLRFIIKYLAFNNCFKKKHYLEVVISIIQLYLVQSTIKFFFCMLFYKITILSYGK